MHQSSQNVASHFEFLSNERKINNINLNIFRSFMRGRRDTKSDFRSIKLHVILSLRSYKSDYSFSAGENMGKERWNTNVVRGKFKSFVDTIILLLWDFVLLLLMLCLCSFIRKFIKPWPIKASYFEKACSKNTQRGKRHFGA